jgi:hypothetical protein
LGRYHPLYLLRKVSSLVATVLGQETLSPLFFFFIYPWFEEAILSHIMLEMKGMKMMVELLLMCFKLRIMLKVNSIMANSKFDFVGTQIWYEELIVWVWWNQFLFTNSKYDFTMCCGGKYWIWIVKDKLFRIWLLDRNGDKN